MAEGGSCQFCGADLPPGAPTCPTCGNVAETGKGRLADELEPRGTDLPTVRGTSKIASMPETEEPYDDPSTGGVDVGLVVAAAGITLGSIGLFMYGMIFGIIGLILGGVGIFRGSRLVGAVAVAVGMAALVLYVLSVMGVKLF